MLCNGLAPNWEERFWPKVQKTDGCWLWLGAKTGNGYGSYRNGGFGRNNKTIPSHRVSWMAHFGDIPEGLCVLHKCDVRGCVNPAHLFLGTKHDNAIDMCTKGRSATGKKNGRYTHPETTARGDQNGSRLHPERRARGNRNGSCLHPERLARGSKNGLAKLTERNVVEIRRRCSRSGVSFRQLAEDYTVDARTVSKAVNRKTWKHVT